MPLSNLKPKGFSSSQENVITLQKPLFTSLFLFLAFLLCFTIILSSLFSDFYIPKEVLIPVCLALLILITYIGRLKTTRHLEIPVIFICLLLYILFLFFCRSEEVQINHIIYGYIIGFFERVTIERLQKFRYKAFFGLFAGVSRMIILNSIDPLIISFGLSLLFFELFLDYNTDKNHQEINKILKDAQDTRDRFKRLVKNYVSESMLMLSTDLTKLYFVNNSFERNFKKLSDTSIKEFLQQFYIDKEQASRLSLSLKEARNNCEDQEQEGSRKIDYSQTANLYYVLETLQYLKDVDRNHSFDFEFIFSYVPSEPSTSRNKLKIKLFPFIWEGKSSFAILINDMTEHYSLLTLKLAEENRDQVFATVSHELRTPLNGILGMVQILSREVTQSHLSKYLRTCESSARLLLSLVNSILDSAQIKNNKFKLNPGTHKLRDITDDILSLFALQFEQKRLLLDVKLADDLPRYVSTDKNRISQILINLVGNALKFTFEGGVTLQVDQEPSDPGSVRFSVIDTGVGIPENEMGNLFRMFGKLEGTASINTQGVGLGLNISNVLAKMLNDNEDDSGIKVESEVGQGSTFSFLIKKKLSTTSATRKMSRIDLNRNKDESDDIEQLLDEIDYKARKFSVRISKNPNKKLSQKLANKYLSTAKASHELGSRISTPPSKKGQKDDSFHSWFLDQSSVSPNAHMSLGFESPTHRQGAPNNFSILIVDDNPFNLLVAQEMILAKGIKAETAITGNFAIDLVRKRYEAGDPFHLILMDCEMPVMNGFQTSRILVEKMRTREIGEVPIVALTAHSADQMIEACLEAGMVDCLTKPILEGEFHKILVKYL